MAEDLGQFGMKKGISQGIECVNDGSIDDALYYVPLQ